MKDSNLYRHAQYELILLGCSDEIQKEVNKCVLDLIDTFSNQEHDGFSGEYVLSLFSKLARFEAIKPLEDNDESWNDLSASSGSFLLQHKRDSRVFKDRYGCFQVGYYIFEDPLYPETWCTTHKSSKRIKSFPYTPKSVRVPAPRWKKFLAKLFPRWF